MDMILQAMRADMIPAASDGRWRVAKVVITSSQSETMARLNQKGMCPWCPPGWYTHLFLRQSYREIFNGNDDGEVVMNDFPDELRKHLEFVMLARGRVLVGGLGLGCVVRGLLARGQVEHVDVIERERAVIRLCGNSVKDDRVTIHEKDAYHGFVKGGPWDYAWWDLHSDADRSEPHLQIIHMDLVKRFEERVKNRQGCWAMPRKYRRSLREAGIMI